MVDQPLTFLLHLGLLLIVIGALTTHFWGVRGRISLRVGEQPTALYTDTEHLSPRHLPFSLQLNDCEVKYYPSTDLPMDYISRLTVFSETGDEETQGRISMNNILVHDNWRFYQTGISDNGVTLTISHDPWGIGFTYGGYLLVTLSILLFFFQRRSLWRSLFLLPIFFLPLAVGAAPKALQKPLADDFGHLWIAGNERIELVETYAIEFTTKLTGSESYSGLNSNQVLTGWLFYYDDWKREPMIKVKSDEAKKILGITGNRAALTDFFSPRGYKLEEPLKRDFADKELRRLDEVVALISGVATGKAFRIYPVVTDPGEAEVSWISWVERSDYDLSSQDWEYVQVSHSSLFSDIATGHYRGADRIITRLRERQLEYLPANAVISAKAESVLNRIQILTLPFAIFALIVALLLLVLSVRSISLSDKGSALTLSDNRRVSTLRVLTLIIDFIFISFSLTLLALRAIVGNHWPLSDGYETLIFLAAFSFALPFVVNLRNHLPLLLAAGILIGGFSLLVANIVASSPKVTPLIPVLSSSWLAIHVMLVMASYSLMLVMAVLGGVGMLKSVAPDEAKRLARLNYLILIPAVFLLLLGIMSGAVWANQSWGRYWGWDPKETCALVTLLIYTLPLHARILKKARGFQWLSIGITSPRKFNTYLLVSILAVLFTYFGANYFLTGLHSYA